MSEPLDPPAAPLKADPETLVLRGRPRSAVRFRRGLIVGTTGAVAAALIGLSWFALQPPTFRKAASAMESDELAARAGPDALANAPGSYSDAPRLGPPLPGDLGRPILEQERSAGRSIPEYAAPPSTPGADREQAAAERERLLAAVQAARSSPVIVPLERSTGTVPEPLSHDAEQTPAGAASAVAARSGVPASQQHKIEFARTTTRGDVNPHGLIDAPSPWMLAAGSVIPASLLTGLDSDLPGIVVAQVTENVRDSATGRTVLIPQGSRLIGSYDSVVAYSQRRALVVWTRIILPDGRSVTLDNIPATDASGFAGLSDRVDSHGWQLLKGIALSTLLGVSTQLSIGGGGDLVRAVRESTQQNVAHAGDQITSRNLEVQPTIRVRPGWPVRVLVNKDLVLQPWRG